MSLEKRTVTAADFITAADFFEQLTATTYGLFWA